MVPRVHLSGNWDLLSYMNFELWIIHTCRWHWLVQYMYMYMYVLLGVLFNINLEESWNCCPKVALKKC